jgi:hypothetical protein
MRREQGCAYVTASSHALRSVGDLAVGGDPHGLGSCWDAGMLPPRLTAGL